MFILSICHWVVLVIFSLVWQNKWYIDDFNSAFSQISSFFSYCRTITAKFGTFVRIDFRDMFILSIFHWVVLVILSLVCPIKWYIDDFTWAFSQISLLYFILQNYYSRIWLFCPHRFPRYVILSNCRWVFLVIWSC